MGGSITLSQVQDKYPRHNLETKLDSGGQKEVFKGEFDGEDIVLKTIIAEDWEPTFARLRYDLGGDRPSQTTRHAVSRTRLTGLG